jgi:hypothetical protein
MGCAITGQSALQQDYGDLLDQVPMTEDQRDHSYGLLALAALGSAIVGGVGK